MSARTVSVSLPDNYVKMLDRAATKQQRSRSDIVRQALEDHFREGSDQTGWRERLVIELLRSAAITSGQAATLLGLSRWDVIELMARHDIPMADGDARTLKQELTVLAKTRGGGR